jgi:hypothetical protein
MEFGASISFTDFPITPVKTAKGGGSAKIIPAPVFTAARPRGRTGEVNHGL